MENIRLLLLKKLRSELTPAEQDQLRNWLQEDAANQALLARLEDEAGTTIRLEQLEQLDTESAWQRLQQKRVLSMPDPPQDIAGYQRRRQMPVIWRWVAAAGLLLLISVVAAYLFRPPVHTRIPAVAAKPVLPAADIPPGGDRAVLTLSDGTEITLDSASDGKLASQGNIKVIKLNSGRLAYEGHPVDASGQLLYNTIRTPKGGQYQLVLADGTRVWLNAASSFRYPVAFIGNSRQVSLTGEGYFEVAKNKAQPFIVEAAGTEVTVLGTHFNVMAYGNEAVQKITLLEGSVQVSKGPHTAIIRPGEQASVQTGIRVVQADAEEATAWKEGRFIFHNTDINEIMRQLERWYDIDVTTKADDHPPHFFGIISRNATLQQVLNMLEVTGMINYRIQGRKLILQ